MTTDRRMPSDAELRRIDREGVKDLATGRKRRLPRSQIARLYGISPQRLRRVLGPLNRRRRGYEVTIRVAASTPDKVRALALRHGYIVSAGAHAGQGSINDLLDALSLGTIAIECRRTRATNPSNHVASITVRLPADAPDQLRRIARHLGIAEHPRAAYLSAILDGIAAGRYRLRKR